MKYKLIFPSIAALSLGAAALISGCTSTEGKKETAPANTPGIQTFALQKGQVMSTLQIPAELIAWQQVDMYAKVNGFIKDLKADIGSEVKAGQVLATLEAPELSAQMAAAESKLHSQEAVYTSSAATYKRMLETSKVPGTVSGNDLEVAMEKMNADKAQLEAARSAYKEASIMVGYLVITAPFDGVISARNANPGAYVGPSGKGSEMPIFTLQDLNHLRLVIYIPELYKSLVKEGQDVNFRVNAYADKTFTANIKRRAGALDTKLRAERVELDVMNPDHKLAPGMVAQTRISMAGSGQGLVVPKSAVVTSAEGTFVLRVEDHKTQRIKISKGHENDSLTEIYGPLQTGDILVKKATDEIHDGTLVK